LEIVSDLTTASFLMALRRFIARRGKPAKLHCDNATTFTGARNQLDDLKKFLATTSPEIVKSCSDEGIQIKFIPPHSPHMGGLWEATVKLVKYHLKRIMNDQVLTFEEFTTVVYQIEACVNSRPLTSLHDHPDDYEPLTAGHFLIGRPLVAMVDPDYETPNIKVIERWQLIQKLVQSFWRKWSFDYLNSLQQRKKWTTSQPN
jgi:hypothetical protein